MMSALSWNLLNAAASASYLASDVGPRALGAAPTHEQGQGAFLLSLVAAAGIVYLLSGNCKGCPRKNRRR